MKKLLAVIAIVILIVICLQARGDTLACDKGVEINGVCRVITGCVYGDSLEPQVCDKFEEPKPTPPPEVPTSTPMSTDQPVYVNNDSWGK